jgi:hypothetical protein
MTFLSFSPTTTWYSAYKGFTRCQNLPFLEGRSVLPMTKSIKYARTQFLIIFSFLSQIENLVMMVLRILKEG